MKKIKISALLLTVIMIFAAVSFSASANTVSGDIGSVAWAYNNYVLTIYGNGAMPDDISASIPWSSNKRSIKSVVVEDGVTNISAYAFTGLSALATVTLGNTVESIGANAVSNCGIVKELVVPASVKSIGTSAFDCCEKVVFGEGMTNIPSSFINGSSYLASVTFPSTIKTVAAAPVVNCPRLNTVTSHSAKITGTVLGDDLCITTVLVNEAAAVTLSTYADIETAVFEEGVTAIPEKACQNIATLCEVEFCDGLKTIGAYAFNGCTGIESVSIPKTVNAIGEKAFDEGITIYGTSRTAAQTFAKANNDIFIDLGCNHDDTSAVKKNQVAATCTADGSYDEVVVCNICEAELGTTHKTVSATSHKWDDGVVTTEATCSKQGVKTFTCTVCHATKTVTGDYDYNNHTNTVKTNAKEAACLTDGYTGDLFCLGCKKTVTAGEVIPAVGYHTWDAGKVTVTPDCTNTGKKVYTCTACKATETEILPVDASKHLTTVISGAKEATCASDGYTGDTFCMACRKTVASGTVIPATGNHNKAEVSRTESTCCVPGTVQYFCLSCRQYFTENLPLDASKHTGEVKTVNQKAATCGNTGYTGDTACAGCGAVLSNGSTIPATGKHTWNSGMVTRYSTCSVAGIKSFACTGCNATKEEYLPLDESRHNNTAIINAEAGNCIKDGYTGDTFCYDCNKIIADGETVKASGAHQFGAWKVVKEASLFEDGIRRCECALCHETKDEPVALNIDYKNSKQYGKLSFTVIDENTRQPIEGIKITITTDKNGSGTIVTDKNGNASIVLPKGSVKVKISGDGYLEKDATIKVSQGKDSAQSISVKADSTTPVIDPDTKPEEESGNKKNDKNFFKKIVDFIKDIVKFVKKVFGIKL